MSPAILLLGNLALGFYLVGAIWAHEVDIFRTWKLVGPGEFRKVQSTHWRKLPYWIFAPLALGAGGFDCTDLDSSGRFTSLGNLGKSRLSACFAFVYCALLG